MPLISLPFNLPPAFLNRLGDRGSGRIVAVSFEPGIDEAAVTDGIDGLVGVDHYVYWEPTRQPNVWAWLTEHAINLGNSDWPATHWLLIDRTTERAYVCEVASARDRVRAQILEDWVG
jgi:hypothetical protein